MTERQAADGFEPAWALLAASEPVQYAPVLGVMRPTLDVSVAVRGVDPTQASAPDTRAEASGDGAAAHGRPSLRADEPVGHSRSPAASRRPMLLGGAAMLAAIAAVGGYLTLERPWQGGSGSADAIEGVRATASSSMSGDVVAARTPATPAFVSEAVTPGAGGSSTGSADNSAPAAAPAESTDEMTAAVGPSEAVEDAGSPPEALDRRSMIRSAQLALADAGLDPGPADGLMGPKTRSAIMSYQDRIGVEADGEVDAALLRQLSTAARPSDDDIPPARLPEPAKANAPADVAVATDGAAKLGGIDGLLSSFRAVFRGDVAGGPADGEALADAVNPGAAQPAGVRR